MKEVFAILVSCAALFIGLWVISWAYGDFRQRPVPPPPGSKPGA